MKYGVGIDVSKGKSTVAILSIEGEVIEMPFDINHDVEDLEKLDKKLQMFSKEDLKIVLEQTGTYHLPILTYLLDKGYCDVNDTSVGMTALMFAARDSTPEMVELLLSYGADTTYTSSDGMTAYDYAVEYNDESVVSLLAYQ